MVKIKHTVYFKSKKSSMNLLCIKSKFGNFTEGKIYNAVSYASYLNGVCTDFRIDDDDHDLYSIEEKHLIKNNKLYFKIVD